MSADFKRSGKGLGSAIKNKSREVEAGVYGSNNAKHALFNEFGTFSTPARPFLTPVIDQCKPALMKKIKEQGIMNVDMASLGKIMAAQVRTNIIDKKIPANAPSTIRKKGFDDPLIETGNMLESVDFKVL